MKIRTQLLVRRFHERFFKKKLSPRLAIYFHAIEPAHYQAFKQCIGYFKMAGYIFVDAAGICCPGSDNRVFISFDDNFRSWTDLLALLNELGIAVTFFVNTLPFRDLAPRATIEDYFTRIGHRGERHTLSTDEIRELAISGHRIGCHSHSHVVLAKIPQDRAEAEIGHSKLLLEQLTENRVVDFSYPFGMRRHFSNALREYCIVSGFKTVSNSIPGLQYLPHRPEAINRTRWDLDADLEYNLINLSIDGRLFSRLTGRSPVG
jgi:peptidoglycan/xylan/chitin deacetylase (PgdA/CDA1 family)